MTHKIVGQYSNNEVTLSEPMVCTAKHLQVGDIVELNGEYVRMYRDGHADALRFWFITELVLEAMVQRQIPAVRRALANPLAAARDQHAAGLARIWGGAPTTRHCRYCETSTIHYHGGIQEFPDKHFTLWNCAVCGDTSSELKCIVDAADFDEDEQARFLMGTGRM